METLLFLLSASVVVAIGYLAFQDERRPAGKAKRSLFRTLDDVPAKAPGKPNRAAPTPGRGRRV